MELTDKQLQQAANALLNGGVVAQPAAETPLPQHSTAHGNNFIVAIDAGHGGDEKGAVSVHGHVLEKDVTLAIAQKAKAYLQQWGNSTVMLRTGDETKNRKDRVAIAQENGAHLLVSIHADTHLRKKMDTPEIYVNNGTSERAESHQAAEYFVHSTQSDKDVIVHGKNLGVLKSKTMPSVLVETMALNKEGEHRAQDPQHIDKIARQIAQGAHNYVRERGKAYALSQSVGKAIAQNATNATEAAPEDLGKKAPETAINLAFMAQELGINKTL